MKIYRGTLIMALSILAVPALFRAQEAGQEKAKPPLPNYFELTPRIGTGGQPDEAGVKQLADKGYQSIINIRASDESVDLAAEEKQAVGLGLHYYMIPFNGRQPSEGQALAFDRLMSALKEEKVFIHCGSGTRVGSLMMIYLALEEGMPVEKAEQEAKKVGLRAPQLLDFARQVIARHQK